MLSLIYFAEEVVVFPDSFKGGKRDENGIVPVDEEEGEADESNKSKSDSSDDPTCKTPAEFATAFKSTERMCSV